MQVKTYDGEEKLKLAKKDWWKPEERMKDERDVKNQTDNYERERKQRR